MVAERNLAIFKVRYDSLQKAHLSAKNEILKMKVSVEYYTYVIVYIIYVYVYNMYAGKDIIIVYFVLCFPLIVALLF